MQKANTETTGPFVTRLSRYRNVSTDALHALGQADGVVERLPAGDPVWLSGDAPMSLYVIEEGWAFHAKTLSTGNRQICQILLPGDVIDGVAVLPGGCSMTSVIGATDLVVRKYDPQILVEVVRAYDDLAAALWWSTVQTENILREHITRTAHHSAAEALGHFLLELAVRCEMAGLTTNDHFPMPMTQNLIGEYLGITPVHVSRTLTLLKNAGYLALDQREARLLRRDDLAEISGFEPAYLYNGCAGPLSSAA